MNKKKLCATLTLSAFAASLLPGMAFADGTVVPKKITELTDEIVLYTSDENGWMGSGTNITFKKGLAVDTGFGYEITTPGQLTLKTPEDFSQATYTVTAENTTTVKKTEKWTIVVGEAPGFDFKVDEAKPGNITFTDTEDKIAQGDVLCVFNAADKTVESVIMEQDANGQWRDVEADINKKITLSHELLEPNGKYVVAEKSGETFIIKALVAYPQEVADEIVENANEAMTAANKVADAIPAELTISTKPDGTGANILTAVKNDENVKKALNDAQLSATEIMIKDADGAIAEYVNENGVIELTDVATAEGTITFEVAGKATKTVDVIAVKAQTAEKVAAAYIADNFDVYDKNSNTATVTMKKGDSFNMTVADAFVGTAVKTNNKIVLSSAQTPVNDKKYIDVKTGKIIASPTESYTTVLSLKFTDKNGTKLTGTPNVTINLTIEPGESTNELPPVEDLDTMAKEELKAVETLAIADKADKLAALEAAQTEMMAEFDAKGIKVTEIKNLKGTDLLAAYNIYKKGNPAKAAFNASVQYLKAVEDALKTAK